MASLYMRFPQGRAKTLTLSYDDGVDTDIRLMEILDKHGIRATFNLNAGHFSPEGTHFPETRKSLRMSKSQAFAAYGNCGHEIACHALTHPYLDLLPNGRATYEIIEDKRRLEEMFGCTIRGLAYPFSTTDGAVIAILKNGGFAYARGGESSHSFEIPTNWYHMPNTCRHKDPKLMELCETFLQRQTMRAPLMFSLMGHSFEFKNDDNWEVMEQFAEKMGGHADIWYAPVIEIVDYITAYEQLRFTVNMDLAENPTATDLWFEYDGKPYMVKAGETLHLD